MAATGYLHSAPTPFRINFLKEAATLDGIANGGSRSRWQFRLVRVLACLSVKWLGCELVGGLVGSSVSWLEYHLVEVSVSCSLCWWASRFVAAGGWHSAGGAVA